MHHRRRELYVSALANSVILKHAGQSYLCVQRGIVALENRQYDATDQLTTSITNIANLMSQEAQFKLRLKIFTLVRHCEAATNASTD